MCNFPQFVGKTVIPLTRRIFEKDPHIQKTHIIKLFYAGLNLNYEEISF